MIVNETIVGQEVWTQVINGDCRPLARDFLEGVVLHCYVFIIIIIIIIIII